jgi:excisionase family DNA binding protein
MKDETKILKDMIQEDREKLPLILTPTDLIEILPFGRSKVYHIIRSGELPAKKVGGSIIIHRDKFLLWLFDEEENNQSNDQLLKI